MMATNIDAKIADLEAKLKQARARKRQIEARLKTQNRKQETRKKILVGAAVLAKVERGDWPQERLLAMMDAALSRADDRALFDLPEITNDKPDQNPALPELPTNSVEKPVG